jgi:hypothetical protein
MGPQCRDRAARGCLRSPSQEHHSGVGPWSSTGAVPRRGGAPARGPARVGLVMRGRPMGIMGPAIRTAWGRWRTGLMPQTVSPGDA